MHINRRTLPARKLLSVIEGVIPALFWILLVFGFDTPAVATMTLICALIHEGGHIFAVCFLKKSFTLSSAISGFRIKHKFISYKEEAIISLGGPLSNLAVFLLIMLFVPIKNEYTLSFAVLNFLTAVSNLLPVRNYDGYHILDAVLSSSLGEGVAERVLSSLSFVFSALLCFLSLYLMYKANTGYWIFFVFAVILFQSIKNDKKIILEENERKKEIS